ncbi:MAG: hypothetical protein ACJAT3_000441 [Akkermansiaceae bacterium]|jgi:hypothetical protein|tara:strand:- start:4639 stop:4776 length:138 start_codon:yes stop_codon:yes gene_type:complete
MFKKVSLLFLKNTSCKQSAGGIAKTQNSVARLAGVPANDTRFKLV